MKKFKNITNFVTFMYFIIFIIYLNVGSLLVSISNIKYLFFSKGIFYFGLVALILFLLKYSLFDRKFKLSYLWIFLLSIFGYLSYYYAFDQHVALYGYFNRHEGLLVILSYYFIFLLASLIDRKYQKKIMDFLLFTGILQIALGTAQTLKIQNIFGYDRTNDWSNNFKFASGVFGNPNFYSSYIIICLMYCYGMLLNCSKKIQRVLYLILTSIFIYGIIIGNTSGCLISSLIILIVTLFFKVLRIGKIKKIKLSKVIIIFLVLCSFSFVSIKIVNKYTHSRIPKTLYSNVQEVIKIFDNGIDDSTGNGRIFVWRKVFDNLPRYLYTGIGIDNFGFIRNGHYLCTIVKDRYQCFDKVHNEYLQKLITEGIFSFISYISLLITTICIYKKRNCDNYISKACFLSFMAYLIQAFFNISVINVAPMFYMVSGFLNFRGDL